MVTGYTKNNLQQFWKTLGPCWAAVCAAANVVVGPMASEPFGNIELNLEALSVIFFFCSGVEGFKFQLERLEALYVFSSDSLTAVEVSGSAASSLLLVASP